MKKLSEAIREGAKLHPKGTGDYVNNDSGIKTCALGAAFIATHPKASSLIESLSGPIDMIDMIDMIEDYLYQVFGPVLNTLIKLPVGKLPVGKSCKWAEVYDGRSEIDLKAGVEILNDYTDWSREKIADWIEDKINEKEAFKSVSKSS
jgi:hypothetical protein